MIDYLILWNKNYIPSVGSYITETDPQYFRPCRTNLAHGNELCKAKGKETLP